MKKSKKPFIIVGVIVALALVAFGVFAVYNSNVKTGGHKERTLAEFEKLMSATEGYKKLETSADNEAIYYMGSEASPDALVNFTVYANKDDLKSELEKMEVEGLLNVYDFSKGYNVYENCEFTAKGETYCFGAHQVGKTLLTYLGFGKTESDSRANMAEIFDKLGY